MLRYLSKFLLDIAPPVAATVIGAWIVTHYINPRTDAAQPRTEAAAKEEPAPKLPLSGASGMSPRAVEQVAVKPVADEPSEARKAAPDKAPVVKQAVAAPRIEDRREPSRDAADLARAALERLRSQTPAEASRASQAAVQPVAAPAAAPIPTPAVASPAQASAAPALPPPVVIAPQREAVAQPPSSPLFSDPARLTPPGEIPVRSADALMQPTEPEGRSLIGGIASAAKSLVDVVIPR